MAFFSRILERLGIGGAAAPRPTTPPPSVAPGPHIPPSAQLPPDAIGVVEDIVQHPSRSTRPRTRRS